MLTKLTTQNIDIKVANDKKIGVDGNRFKLTQSELDIARTIVSFEKSLIADIKTNHPKDKVMFFKYHNGSKTKRYALINDDDDSDQLDLASIHYECNYWNKVLATHHHVLHLTIRNQSLITPSHIESLISDTIDFIYYGSDLDITKIELRQARKLIKILSSAVTNYRSHDQILSLF